MGCKWCQKEGVKFAKSHIIPAAFVNYGGRNDKKIFSSMDYPRRSPAGPYDMGILCVDCEAKYQGIDSDAASILLHKFDEYCVPFDDNRDNICFQLSGECKQPIKKFLAFLLWKASVSTRREFASVKLGAYEDKIRNEIEADKRFESHEYSFVAFKIENLCGSLCPRKWKIQSDEYYQVYAANFLFYIKVDSQITPMQLKEIAEYENVIFFKSDKVPDNHKKIMIQIVESSSRLTNRS